MRLMSLGGSTLGWKVAEGCGGSIGPRTGALSGELPSVKIGEEDDDEGVTGRGLSGEGVRVTVSSGEIFGFSERVRLSMSMSVVGKGTRVLTEKVEVPARNMGRGIDPWEG